VAFLPVFAVAMPLVVVAVTGRFVQVAKAGAALAAVGALVYFVAGGHSLADLVVAVALATVGLFLWCVGAAVGWLNWERRHGESV